MKNLRGDFPPSENNDDCRVLAPFVMTLFDGEADEIEARRARAHLLVCQNCARRWLDWNRSRDLLQSAPVPAPPPHLLWRVLMACRLANAPQRANAQRANAPQRVESQRAHSNGALPGGLSAQILARTTRSGSPAAPAPAPAPRRVPPLRVTALAVPALAICLMVLQRDAWFPATSISTSLAPASRASNAVAPSRSRSASAVRAAMSVAPVRIARAATPAPQRFAAPRAAIAASVVTGSPRLGLSPVALTRREARIRPALASTAAQEEGFFARSEAVSPDSMPAVMQVAMSQVVARRTALTSAALERSPRRALAARFAALSQPKRASRLRTARWQTTTTPALRHQVRIAHRSHPPAPGEISAPPQVLRVSLPSARAPQPARLLAENFDSDDERTDDVRSVVEDFRATLDPDESAISDLPADLPADDEDNNG